MPATSRATHPNGSVIVFTEADHKYVIENSPTTMVSSTTFIHHYFPKFDAEAVSMKVAKKQNPTLDAVNLAEIAMVLRQEWEANADKACTYGTRVHEVNEDFLAGRTPRHQPSSQKELSVMNQGIAKCQDFLSRYKLIGQELIIFSEKYNLCGTIDLLMYDPATDTVWILDWKTNKEIKTTNKWKTGFEPIQHLQDCNFIHYSLQLNLYQRILEDEGYFPKGTKYNRAIIHLHEETGTREMVMPDMQTEITALLLHFAHNPWHLPF